MEEEAIGDDDAEVTVNKVEEEMIVRILTMCHAISTLHSETLRHRCKWRQ